jgi:hypothetical protein
VNMDDGSRPEPLDQFVRDDISHGITEIQQTNWLHASERAYLLAALSRFHGIANQEADSLVNSLSKDSLYRVQKRLLSVGLLSFKRSRDPLSRTYIREFRLNRERLRDMAKHAGERASR